MIAPGQFGPRPAPGGGTTFRIWAPAASSVDLVAADVRPMQPAADGWFELTAPDLGPGTLYRFRIDGELDVPDPAAAFQPQDVAGPSETIDHGHRWTCNSWRGRPWHEAAILEIHVGTFTPEGTFRAAIDRFDAVVDTGFTAIELMPVADFSGRWNWGYDGVLWFAPDSSYGRPEDLRALVDAAHRRGLMVLLDVVYNHFGPEGNFLPRYAPQFFSSATSTPWGDAIDYDIAQVRAFAVENALHWLDRYRFDGLRLDAVHAIARRGTPSILEAISRAAGELAISQGRYIHLVLENDDNEAELLDPAAPIPRGRYRAQWNDDYHHAWHVLATGQRSGYYGDYDDALAHLVKILSSGFAYQGQPSAHRGGAARGTASARVPPAGFVCFLQNHDQIGNRARGERLDTLAKPEAIEAALAITLLAPMPPLMFMGEPWGETRPFPFFCDFDGELADAVRAGRRREFKHDYDAAPADQPLPDPLSGDTVAAATLDWDAADRPAGRARLDLVARLLDIRRRVIAPQLVKTPQGAGHAAVADGVVTAKWQLDGGRLHLTANLSDRTAAARSVIGTAIWGEPSDPLAPWSVLWTWEA